MRFCILSARYCVPPPIAPLKNAYTFIHITKSFNGASFSCRVKPDPMFFKRHVPNKTHLFVEEAELIEASPHYAHVGSEDGIEISFSLCNLAPNSSAYIGCLNGNTDLYILTDVPVVQNEVSVKPNDGR